MKNLEPASTGAYIHNPATGERLVEIQEHDPSILPYLVEKTRMAQTAWVAEPFKTKRACALKAANFIQRNADRISQVIANCTGKTKTEALATEVLPSVIAWEYYSKRVPRVVHPKKLAPSSFLFLNKKSILYRAPYGVIGIISPWNYPFGIPLHEVAAALLTGNGVLLKVATQSQPVGELIQQMVGEADFPKDLFHLVHLPGALAGTALLDSGIDKLFFTGSTSTGRRLMEEAGKRLIPISLELGGKDAMIVLSDAPLERAAAGAVWAGVSNCGQSCGGVERIYVEQPVYAEFVKLLRYEVQKLRQGGSEFDVDFGSLTTKEQRRTVESQVQEALAKGGRLLESSPLCTEGGPSTLFYPAQVIEVDTEDLAIMQEETFGPVLAITAVPSVDEAIKRTNSIQYGLTASVWSLSPSRAQSVASQLQAGVVTINDHLMTHGMPETPWGGFKNSGIGRTHGDEGIEEMTQGKVLVWERLPRLKRNIFWQPIDSTVYKGLLGAVDLIRGHGFLRKAQGLLSLLRLVLKRLRF